MTKKYPYHQSPFFCLRSKKKLAELLHAKSVSALWKLVDDKYYRTVKIDDKVFTPPISDLRRLHDRVQRLLARIDVPKYLHSGVKGRSNLTNALIHESGYGMIKTDITRFFPSTSERKVRRFFYKQMRCSPDVAELLSKLLTKNGAIPMGSPCSTSLAYWANKDMFDEICNICESSKARFSVYVDDISISMRGLNRNLLRRINGVIRRYGYKHHKHRVYKPSQPKVITGIVRQGDRILVTKGTHRKLQDKCAPASDAGRRAYISYVESH